MDKLLQGIWHRFLRVAETAVDYLESESSFHELQEGLRRELDNAALGILQLVIEAMDAKIVNAPQERRNWHVVRRDDPKRLLTMFGMLEYRRTYFRHKRNKKYRYLVDERIGVTPHTKVDATLKARLVERAAAQSYRISGQWSDTKAFHVSGQTVMNTIREAVRNLQAENLAPPGVGEKRRVEYLYIEADEDHVGNQDGPRWQPRLVYVHEGVEAGSGGDRRLKNPCYFGGLYKGTTPELWDEVWRYLDRHYDLDYVQVIFVSGDGAAWIRQACEVIPKTVFVLDRFHASKYVTAAVGPNISARVMLWRALTKGTFGQVKAILEDTLEQAETKAHRGRIIDTLKYFRRQWDGVLAWRRYKDVWPGCSAEGHVSHIYAERLSSRPMAWRQHGVEAMARLRVMRANGHSIARAYLQSRPKHGLRVDPRWLQRLRSTVQTHELSSHEVFNNLPALRGRSTMMTKTLRDLAYPAI